jgi:hypothetical protein
MKCLGSMVSSTCTGVGRRASSQRRAIPAGRCRSGNHVSLDWRDGEFAARLAEAIDHRWAPGSGRARGLLHFGGAQETGRRELGLFADHAWPRRGTGISGRVSVLVESCIRETVAIGQRGVRLGAHHYCHTLCWVQRPCCRGPATSCPRHSPRGDCTPFMMSLVSGWIRERTDSVWPSVFGHNLSNLVIPFASLFT